MKSLEPLAMIVLVLAISQPLSAQPKRPVLSYSQAPCRPNRTQAAGSQGKAESCESMNRVRQAGARPALSYFQKHALVEAYRAGDHYGIGLLYASVVWQESKLCKFKVGDHGRAHGCAQLHESAVKAVTGTTLTSWELTDPNTQELNLAIGARYLDLCLQRFGYPRGVACYNVGVPCAAQPACKRSVKRAYTKAVLANMKLLERLPRSVD